MALATLSIDLVAKTAAFEKDLKRTADASEASANRIARSMEAVKSTVAGIAGLVTVDLFAGLVTRSADYTDQIGKMAQRIGATTEEFSAMAYAASLADVSNETLATGMKKLSTELASGGDKLAQLGIKTKDAAGNLRSNSDVMGDVAERFATMKDGALKTAIAVDIFGRSGADLIPLLNGGRNGLKAAADEADRFGLVVGKDAVAAAEQFNDNLTRLQAGAKGAAVSLTSNIIKALGEATTAFLKATQEGSKFEAFLAGLNTLVYGDDRHMNNVMLAEGTERVLAAENALDKARAAGDSARVERLTKALALRKAELATTQNYKKVLDELDASNAPKPKGPAPTYTIKPPKAPKAATKEMVGDSERALAAYVKTLESATGKSQELTEVEKARLFLTTLGTTGEIAQVNELVIGMATRIDQEKELVEILKLKRAAATAPGDAVNQDNAWFAAAIAATPSAKLDAQRADMQRLAEGFTSGVFGDPASAEAVAKYGETASAMLGNLGGEVKALDGDFASLGATFSSSLEDAIVNGNDLRSVMQGLGDDILRITVRKTISEPLGNALTESLKGFSLGSLFGFANGGIMTGRGPVPLRAYATGGVASSPQLAMYGEGSTPEAFVPLPDGRRIPVQMKGASAGQAVVVNITNTIGTVASQSDVVAGMRTVRAQIMGELARGQRMGGGFAS